MHTGSVCVDSSSAYYVQRFLFYMQILLIPLMLLLPSTEQPTLNPTISYRYIDLADANVKVVGMKLTFFLWLNFKCWTMVVKGGRG